MTEPNKIKDALETLNRAARLKLKLKLEGLENMTIAEMKELDPVLLEGAKNKGYRQILDQVGVDFLGF